MPTAAVEERKPPVHRPAPAKVQAPARPSEPQQLQRTKGNQAAAALLQRSAVEEVTASAATASTATATLAGPAAPKPSAPTPSTTTPAPATLPGASGAARLLAPAPPKPVQAIQRSALAPSPSAGLLTVQRIGLPSLSDIVQQIPGYDMLTLVIGFDPATGRSTSVTPSSLIRAVMGLVPGGRFVHDRLAELEILQPVFAIINGALQAHNLTSRRFQQEADAAWQEVDLTPRLGIIDDAIAVVRRRIQGVLRDVRNAASSVVNQIITLIKEAAIRQAERLLAADETARNIYELAKAVLRYDPIRGVSVSATTEDIIARFLTLIGRTTELEQMRTRGTLAQTAAWVDQQITQFLGIIGEVRSLVTAAIDAISFEQLPNLPTNLRNLVTRGVALVRRIADFATSVATKVLELIKDSLLGMLDERAQHVQGFHLITVLLGRNPITGHAVPRTATNIIKGFITLLPDGEAQFDQLNQTGVIPQAAARIEAAIERLGISWDMVVSLFRNIWDALSIEDLVNPVAAFLRIIDQFSEPIGRLFRFVLVVMREIFLLALRLMGFPFDLIDRIVTNAMAAWERIKANPIGFFNNLLAALKKGFGQFFDHIGRHLVNGLAGWLVGGLREAGIQIPEEITLRSVLGVALQVLDITVDHVWRKLAEKIGEERVAMIRRNIDRLTGVWTFIKDVQERGIIAIWEYIKTKVSDLWNMVLDRAKTWILTELVEAAIQKILSMLDPTGIMAVINSFMAFFRAVQSVIRYMNDILRIVDRYVATLAAIAAGQIQPGADMMEGGLAASIPVAIGFLMNQVGLGNVSEKIKEFIQAGRELVDRAIGWLIDKAISMGRSILQSLGLMERPPPGQAPGQTPDQQGPEHGDTMVEPFTMDGSPHTLTVDLRQKRLIMASALPGDLITKIDAARTRLRAERPPANPQRLTDLEAIRMIAVDIDADEQLYNVSETGAQRNAAGRDAPSNDPLWNRIRGNLQRLGPLLTTYGTTYRTRELAGDSIILDGITKEDLQQQVQRYDAIAQWYSDPGILDQQHIAKVQDLKREANEIIAEIDHTHQNPDDLNAKVRLYKRDIQMYGQGRQPPNELAPPPTGPPLPVPGFLAKLRASRTGGAALDVVRTLIARASQAERNTAFVNVDDLEAINRFSSQSFELIYRMRGVWSGQKEKFFGSSPIGSVRLREYASWIRTNNIVENASGTHLGRGATRDSIHRFLGSYIQTNATVDIRSVVNIVDEGDWYALGLQMKLSEGQTEDDWKSFAAGAQAYQWNGRVYCQSGVGDYATMIHEVLHLYSERNALQMSCTPFNEGITELVTQLICRQMGWTVSVAYADEVRIVAALLQRVGYDPVMQAYFRSNTLPLAAAFNNGHAAGATAYADFLEHMRNHDFDKAGRLARGLAP